LNETPFMQTLPLVEALASALYPRFLDRPFVFFGHSLGGLLAFELARELRRRHDLLPVHLFVSGSSAPSLPYPRPPIHALPDTEFLEELRQFSGTSEEVLAHHELMALLLPALRADFAIRETYVYADEPPLDCPISAYGGVRDDRVGRDRLEAWADQTSRAFSLTVFPGDHFFLNTARPRLLQTISRELEQHVGRET
jgi:medium-chain acyl-[acyl-carrier-protein] hydrolase